MPTPCDPVPTPTTDLAAEIARTAADPQSATIDGNTATTQPIPDLIRADQYLAAKGSLRGSNAHAGPRSGWGTLRPARVVPPGAS